MILTRAGDRLPTRAGARGLRAARSTLPEAARALPLAPPQAEQVPGVVPPEALTLVEAARRRASPRPVSAIWKRNVHSLGPARSSATRKVGCCARVTRAALLSSTSTRTTAAPAWPATRRFDVPAKPTAVSATPPRKYWEPVVNRRPRVGPTERARRWHSNRFSIRAPASTSRVREAIRLRRA
jgi:hypothetical protein